MDSLSRVQLESRALSCKNTIEHLYRAKYTKRALCSKHRIISRSFLALQSNGVALNEKCLQMLMVQNWRFFVCYPQRACWSAILDEMKEIGRFRVLSFSPRWPTNKLAGGKKRKSASKFAFCTYCYYFCCAFKSH